MKKLLFTAIAAAGAAFGLQAAVTLPSGTSFEGVDASAAPVALNGASGVTYLGAGGSFSFPTGEYKADITAYATGEAPRHIDAFSAVDGNYNFLDVKTTFGNPLNYGLEDAQDIGEGLYFDSLVKFTACDEAPTTDSYTDAKIVVWVQEDEDNHTTNFWVKAGQYANSAWGSAAYKCTNLTDFDMTAFHRLTIKAIKDITTNTTPGKEIPGFVVFVDGEKVIRPTTGGEDPGLSALTLNASAAEFDNGKALFPSLIRGTVPAIQIASVGFDGQGAIDDIVLTATAPDFAKDNEFFTVTMGQNVTGFKYAVNSEEAVAATAAVQLPYTAGMTVTISDVTCADGFMYKELTGDTGVDVDGNVFTPGAKDLTGTITAKASAASINGTPYETVADAVDAANDITEPGEYTLKLFGAASDIVLENGNENVKLIIDLAGQTISSESDYAIIVSDGDVTIINSTDVLGTVNAGDSGSVMVAGGALLITAGKYEGAIVNEDAELAITDGMFKVKPDDQYAPEGKVFALDADSGYYVVSEQTGPFSGGTGTAADPYQIANADDLKALATFVADGSNTVGVCFEQTDNITWTDDDGTFTGIGTYNTGTAFKGVYDGANHAISNIKFGKFATGAGAKTTYRGLFNQVTDATIKNLVMNNVLCDSELPKVEFGGAFFVGGATGNNSYTNLTSNGKWYAEDIENGTSHNLAGIVARVNSGKDTFVACTNNANLYCRYTKCGGMVAYFAGSGVFENCCNNGNLTMHVLPGDYSDLYAAGCGGLVSMPCDGNTFTFKDCCNTGVIGGDFSGDPAGLNRGQMIGSSNNGNPVITDLGGNVGRADTPAFGSNQGAKTTTDTKFAFQFATSNGDGTVTFCAKPTAAGSFKVMGKNALAISFGEAEGDQLVLDATVADYSGTVTSAVDGMDAVASVVGKITTYTIQEPITAIKLTVTYGENITQVKVGETVVSASGAEIDVMPGSPYAITVTGADFYKFAFGTLTGCTAQDVSGLAITINSGADAAAMAITATQYNPQNIADDPRPASSIAAELGIMNGKLYMDDYGMTAKERLAKAVKWGETKGSLAELNAIKFNDLPGIADKGTGPKPANAEAEAFLLDCAVSDLATAKAAFKIPAFEIDAEGNVSFGTFEDDGDYGNGHLKQLGATAVDGDYIEDCENPSFFKFELQK